MNRAFSGAALFVLLGVLSVVACCGCGPKGPARYTVSGTVTFEDQQVPVGTLIFNADHQAGNTGPQGRANILNGTITTQRGMGVVGGPHWLQITGFDGQAFQGEEGVIELGKPLFPMAHQQVELPKRDVTLAIRVTGNGADPNVEVEIVD